MCDYCNKDNTKGNLRGSDGVIFDKGEHYLYIEHFQNEIYKILINYCPKCGRELEDLLALTKR